MRLSNRLVIQVRDSKSILSVHVYLRPLLCVFLTALIWLVVLSPIVSAQNSINYMTSIGSTPFSTTMPVQLGTVDLSNGNLHLTVPLGTWPQRGDHPFQAALVYDSRIWVPANVGGTYTWQPTNVPNSQGGWRFVTSPAIGGTTSFEEQVYNCNGTLESPPYTRNSYVKYFNFQWTDPYGTVRMFPITTYLDRTHCFGDTPTGSAFAIDSSGFKMFVANHSTAINIYAPDGSQVFPSFEDSNGNTFGQDSSGNVIDTLGRKPVVVTTTCNGNSNQTCYDALNSQGTTSRYIVTTGSITVSTSFGASGVTEYSGNVTVIQSIQLPDSTSYIFSYDNGGAGTYGELTSTSLPSGGSVSNGYTTYTDPFGNINRWVNSYTAGGSTWNYAFDIISTCPNGFSFCQKSTVSKPSADTNVYTFGLNNGAWAAEVDTYNFGGSLLSSAVNTWILSKSCPLTGCTGAAYVQQQSLTTTFPSTSSTSLSKTTQLTFANQFTQNITQISEWKFYTGSLPSTADRTTAINYLIGTGYTNANIVDRPVSVTVTDITGTQLSKTNYSYDGTGGLVCINSPGTCVTGVVNHDDTNYGTGNSTRGNLTQVQQWVSGSNYLSTTLVHDITGQIVSVADPASNITSMSYADSFFNDNNSNPPASHSLSTPTNAFLTQVTQPTVGPNSFVSHFGYYFGTGQLAQSTDVNGQVSYAHYYDPFSRPTESLPPFGWSLTAYPSTTEIDSYTGVGSATPSTGCSGCVHNQLVLESLGRPATSYVVNNPDGPTTATTVYDTNGRVQSVSAPYRTTLTASDTAAYDGLDRPTSISHLDGTSSHVYYGAAVSGAGGNSTQLCLVSMCGLGFPILYVDEAGKQRQTWTDGFGNLIEVDEPGGTGPTSGGGSAVLSGSEQFVAPSTYDTGTAWITVNGVQTSVSYGQGSTAASVAAALANALNAGGSGVIATFDGSTILLTANATGSSSNYSLSSGSSTSQPGTFSSPSFSVSVSGSSLTGGASSSPGGMTAPAATFYSYDAVGNLQAVIEGLQSRAYTYDGLGRMLSAAIPETNLSGVQKITYGNYDTDATCSASFPGQLVSTVDARGVRTCMQYDAQNRVTQVSYIVVTGVPATSTVVYHYDAGGASAYALGRLTSMDDALGNGSESYVYDQIGRVTQLKKIVDGVTYTTSYAYNSASEPTAINYPSTRAVQIGYDAIGRLCAVATSANSTCSSVSSPYASSFTYNAPSQITGLTLGNGVAASLGYSSNRLQLTSLAYVKSSTNLFSLNYFYTHDSSNCPTGTTGNNGQIQCIQDVTDASGAGRNGRSVSYTYDPLSRLSTALTTGTTGAGGYAQWGLSWTYDRYGNRTGQSVTAGGAPGNSLSVSSTTNQINGMTGVSYDANGNMMGDGVNTSMTYDGANHLVSFSNGTSGGATYVYDGNGLRVEKTSGGATTVYIFSGSKVIAEYAYGAASSLPSKEYVYSGSQLIYTADSSVKYHLRDHLSVRVNTDSNGIIIGEQGHFPFGEPWYENNTTTKWKFTTYERDPESGSGGATGNDYALARYYVNRLGRFSSLDPLAGDVGNPQSLNRFSYALNDPINLIDPSGSFCIYWDDSGVGTIDNNSDPTTCSKTNGEWHDPDTIWIDVRPDGSGSTGGGGDLLNPFLSTFGPGGVLYPQGGGPDVGPGQQSFAGCVAQGGDIFSAQGLLQFASGGHLGNGFISNAFLGNSFSSAIEAEQNLASGNIWGATKSVAPDVAGRAAGPAAVLAAKAVPNVVVSVSAVQVTTTATSVSVESFSAAVSLKGLAEAGAESLKLGLKAAESPKLIVDAAGTAFSAALCAIVR